MVECSSPPEMVKDSVGFNVEAENPFSLVTIIATVTVDLDKSGVPV